ncbi:hypothetical protein HH297_16420, partial [Xanthomonas sp. Kuri4-3]
MPRHPDAARTLRPSRLRLTLLSTTVALCLLGAGGAGQAQTPPPGAAPTRHAVDLA